MITGDIVVSGFVVVVVVWPPCSEIVVVIAPTAAAVVVVVAEFVVVDTTPIVVAVVVISFVVVTIGASVTFGRNCCDFDVNNHCHHCYACDHYDCRDLFFCTIWFTLFLALMTFIMNQS